MAVSIALLTMIYTLSVIPEDLFLLVRGRQLYFCQLFV